jgi:hypothetical protein
MVLHVGFLAELHLILVQPQMCRSQPEYDGDLSRQLTAWFPFVDVMQVFQPSLAAKLFFLRPRMFCSRPNYSSLGIHSMSAGQ